MDVYTDWKGTDYIATCLPIGPLVRLAGYHHVATSRDGTRTYARPARRPTLPLSIWGDD